MWEKSFIILCTGATLLSASGHLEQGFISLKNKDYGQAEFHFKNALKLTPDNLDAGLGLAQAYVGSMQFNKAEELLLSMQKNRFDEPKIHIALGQVYLAQNKYHKAAQSLERGRRDEQNNTALDQSLAAALFFSGVDAYQHGNKHKAAADLGKSVQYDSTNLRAVQNLAITLYDLDRDDEAMQALEKGLAQEPGHKVLLTLKAKIQMRNKAFGDLVKTLKTLYQYYPDDVEVGIQLAYFLRYQGEYVQAVTIYNDLYERYPSRQDIIDAWVHFHTSKKDYENARKLYLDFLKTTPDSAAVFEKIAEIWQKEENYDQARMSYKQLLDIRPCDIETWKRIAETWVTQDSVEMAEQVYRKTLDCAVTTPDSLLLYSEIAKLYEDRDPQISIKAYHTMIELNPEWDYPYVRLGLLLYQVGLDTAYVNYYRMAIMYNTPNPIPYFHVAQFHQEKGDSLRAKEMALAAVRKGLIQRKEARDEIVGQLQENEGQISLTDYKSIGKMSRDVEGMLPILQMSIELWIQLLPEWQRSKTLNDLWDQFPHDTVLPEYLGQVLEEEELLDDALVVYQRLLKNNVRSAAAHWGMARIYDQRKEKQRAIMEYKRIIEIEPEDTYAYEALIDAYKQSNNLEQLEKEWQIKAEADKQNKTLQQFLDSIR